ncbi:aldehyde ferredoxin oxidoreductase N-terminal domain-containing protein [Chloroflexota bacterium]
MSGGYLGKILSLDLTSRKVSTIDTSKYEEYGGGIGIGTAIFWDLCADKLPFDAYDPQNVVTLMTSPLSGTLVPGVARMEVNGLGPQSYPIHWFTRSNFGGRFSGQLKSAGWDGIVVRGKADKPVWVNIVNDKVTFEDASGLWGKDTWTAQQTIWDQVIGQTQADGWSQLGSSESSGRTTQKPAVICTGPLGEAKAGELGCLIHDIGNASGQGGFGAVFGSKNLKAISVLGSGGVDVADPKALIEAWQWSASYRNAPYTPPPNAIGAVGVYGPPFGTPDSGPVACMGCPRACHGRRYKDGTGAEQFCATPGGALGDAFSKWGANTYPMLPHHIPAYLKYLSTEGILGPGKVINSNLDFEKLAERETETFIQLFESIVEGNDIGADIRDGIVRACLKWGREEDWKAGILAFPYWGWPEHAYDPRCEVEWGYGSILGGRDINEHMIAWRILLPIVGVKRSDAPINISAQEAAQIYAEKLIPYQGDPLMIDYSTANIYSEHMAKLVAWHRHYTSFYQEGLQLCDFVWPDTLNAYRPDHRGMTPDGELKFFNAVTGKNLTFVEGMETGRKVWNLRNAIWTLQGRHRDMVYFQDYIYNHPTIGQVIGPPYFLPTCIDGKWDYTDVSNRTIDRTKFDDFKTIFYKLEGWDTKSGWPTRATLESLELKNVADLLQSRGKLGS